LKFIGPNHVGVSCTGIDGWEQKRIHVFPGDATWRVQNPHRGFGYLDNICIEYLGCKVTMFNVMPIGIQTETLGIVLRLASNYDVKNITIELGVPHAAEIDESSILLTGFLSEATHMRTNDRLIFTHNGSSNSHDARIEAWIRRISSNGSYEISVKRIELNGKDQHRWNLNRSFLLITDDDQTVAESLNYG
jgi:hypothetical protein